MPGYEDLTPDQLMLIMYLITTSVIVFSLSRLIIAYLQLRTVKYIEVNITQKPVKPHKSWYQIFKEKREKKKQDRISNPKIY